jgi:hypothetical protein
MKQRLVGTFFIVLIALLAYQAEPVTGTIGWVAVALLTISLLATFRR